MRFLFPVAIAIAAGASAQAADAPASPLKSVSKVERSQCPDAARYLAQRGGQWPGKPLGPQKLSQLPPADAFAAMLRTDERGCVVLVKYRDVRR